MAGRLLFFILMYSFHKIQAQDHLRPKLTVSPAVITVTDSVVLNCQPPSSVFVSECHFHIIKGATQTFSCLETLTATELLKMSHQSSPAEVEVFCFYIIKSGPTYSASPPSETFSITIKTLPPPKLTVNPAVITETDSVTLNCQTPSSVSVSQCYFFTLSGGTVRLFSCLKTLTGTELLKMSNQSSPAEVKVKCSYSVKVGELKFHSPDSDTSSITIHRENEEVKPELTTSTSVKMPPTDKGITKTESSRTQTMSTFSMTTGPTVSRSAASTPVKVTSGIWILKFVALAAGCGVTVGVILLISATLWNKRSTVSVCGPGVFSFHWIQVGEAPRKKGSKEVERQDPQNENLSVVNYTKMCDTYHFYSTISDWPRAASVQNSVVYYTMQSH